MTWRESNTILRSKLHPSEAPAERFGQGLRHTEYAYYHGARMAPDESGNYKHPICAS